MAGRKRGTRNADPEKVQNALSAWVRLGSSKAAAEETGVSDSTLRTWKERHPEQWDSLRRAHAHELQERHAHNVRRAWSDLDEAASIAMQKIREGLYSDGREFLALCRVVSEFAKAGDHVARLDADKPTSITETRTRAELLDEVQEHLQRVRAMGLDIDDASLSHTLGERH